MRIWRWCYLGLDVPQKWWVFHELESSTCTEADLQPWSIEVKSLIKSGRQIMTLNASLLQPRSFHVDCRFYECSSNLQVTFWNHETLYLNLLSHAKILNLNLTIVEQERVWRQCIFSVEIFPGLRQSYRVPGTNNDEQSMLCYRFLSVLFNHNLYNFGGTWPLWEYCDNGSSTGDLSPFQPLIAPSYDPESTSFSKLPSMALTLQ